MSAKISAAKRAAFLKALAETGNQTIAAERAKVSRSWVWLHRSRDAGFDAAVRGAVAEARESLARPPHPAQPLTESPSPARGEREGGNRPGHKWRYQDGEELVVRGTGGSRRAGAGPDDPTGPRRVQIARARVRQWTASSERQFLEVLATTCNVKAACAAVGLTPASAYNHADRWPGFARAWQEALEIGADKIDWAIIESAKNIFSGNDFSGSAPIADMDFDRAIQALRLHQNRLSGSGRRPGRVRMIEPGIEDVRAEILRKVAACQRAESLREAGRGERQVRR